ncbi:unnamed protein product [Mytilus coruscus]|uniref:SOCS box domain-containing protein n=1 Tax=Mytilus coruscus TaxID=42192 RepID=A0A6J8C240_MYTCO|nr:unnamed protein product [Mytilus coruscus]
MLFCSTNPSEDGLLSLNCCYVLGDYGLYITEQNLFTAIGRGDIEQVKTLIQSGVNPQCLIEGWNPLTVACELNKEHILEFLIDLLQKEEEESRQLKEAKHICYTPFIDDHNGHGDTPLTCAARRGHINICEALLHANAFVNETTSSVQQTPLLLAIENDHTELVEFLLLNGADVQIADNVNITPLYAAIKGQNVYMVDKLIQAGCDINIGSQDHAPIFLAARLGRLDIVKILSQAGCDINIANKYGVTPLYESVHKGHFPVSEYLVHKGCNKDKTDIYGVCPLHIASMAGDLETVKLLFTAGADLRLRTQQGLTALHLAMEMNRYHVVEYFLTKGANILRKPHSDNSLKSIASVFERKNIETVEVLLRYCPNLPLHHYPGLSDIFSENGKLLKLLFLSGIKTMPGVLTIPRLHPFYVQDKDLSQWLKDYQKNPTSLKSLCRTSIRRSLGNTLLYKINSLVLPNSIKDYICLREIC